MTTTSKLTEIDYLKAWAIFFVLVTVGGFIIGLVLGTAFGGVLRAIGMPVRFVAVMTRVLAFLASLPVSYFSFRFCVLKFLLPKVTDVPAPPMPAAT